MLRVNRTIRALNLATNKIDEAGVTILELAMRETAREVDNLDLEGNPGFSDAIRVARLELEDLLDLDALADEAAKDAEAELDMEEILKIADEEIDKMEAKLDSTSTTVERPVGSSVGSSKSQGGGRGEAGQV